ncbi:D-aspartate oxidase-like isoform X2 [Mya arenaria]|nr:D-aspartate oxidase-like isoform X2 [Mya arenaria]XP_052816615.1 D-aspartate oxidase-like isoform X2 [Mya arenaria]XP_052816616.1 D-aspartate oxidase-like isoform X2 [Mya arenaria]XP_052816617.1 D-aspartate oxidase-like isoform X2 [Mya arenaria]
MAKANIGIVGAGIIGLSTALNIQKRLPSAKVTIYADRFDNETTSHGAGGLFRPNVEHLLGVDPDTVTRWSVEGFKFYSSLASSPEAATSGQMIMPGYVFSNTPVKDPLYKRLVYSFRELTAIELQKLQVDYKYGYQVTTVITYVPVFLPWLMVKFKDNGGRVEKRTVKSLEEFVGVHDMVVNCSGFRSRDLVGDKSVYPVRGHLIRIKAPWIKYWIYTEDSAYIIPGYDEVSIGGIRQKDNFNLEIDPKDTEGIKERCYKLWPSLKEAPVLREWVDLRPHRDPLRLEQQVIQYPSGPLKVVHNYGHGALGITLAWGTSIDAANLVVEGLTQPGSKL